MRQQILQRHRAGFTIIELLIATLIFSMVILLITIGVLSFTRAYYKGVNQSTTQNATRLILEDIAQSIQFSGGDVQPNLTSNNGSDAFCIGNKRYSYIKGKQLTDETPLAVTQTKYALVSEKLNDCAGGAARDLSDAAGMDACIAAKTCTELLRPMMRLSNISIAPTPATSTDVYRVTIRIVYGDDDLLVNAVPVTPASTDARCATGISGVQYCAQAELTTIVKKRISQ